MSYRQNTGHAGNHRTPTTLTRGRSNGRGAACACSKTAPLETSSPKTAQQIVRRMRYPPRETPAIVIVRSGRAGATFHPAICESSCGKPRQGVVANTLDSGRNGQPARECFRSWLHQRGWTAALASRFAQRLQATGDNRGLAGQPTGYKERECPVQPRFATSLRALATCRSRPGSASCPCRCCP